MNLQRYEKIVSQLFYEMDAEEWCFQEDVLTNHELSSAHGLLPIWTAIAIDNARGCEFIQTADEFPVGVHASSEGAVDMVATIPDADTDKPRVPHSVALLFIVDGIYDAMSLADRSTMHAERVVDLTPAINAITAHYVPEPTETMGDAPETAPNPTRPA